MIKTEQANAVVENFGYSLVVVYLGAGVLARDIAAYAFVTATPDGRQRFSWVNPHDETQPQSRPVSHSHEGEVKRFAGDYLVFIGDDDYQLLVTPLKGEPEARFIDEWLVGRTPARLAEDRQTYSDLAQLGAL